MNREDKILGMKIKFIESELERENRVFKGELKDMYLIGRAIPDNWEEIKKRILYLKYGSIHYNIFRK